MFWRKKPDSGFEWHEYIRTTVLVRRKARKQRVEDARRAAGEQMRAAGVGLAAGSRAAGSAAVEGARAGAGALGLARHAAWAILVHGLRGGVLLLAAALRRLTALVARPRIGTPLAFAGAAVVGAGLGRWRGVGLDAEAVATLVIGTVLMACLLAMLARWKAWEAPPLLAKGAGVVVGGIALAGATVWLASSGVLAGLGKLAAIDNLPLIGAEKTLRGSAHAEGGDRLRVADTVVRLSGIEAPEADQRCSRGGRTWRCGASAEAALARLVNGRRVSCAVSGRDEAGRSYARCMLGKRDVAAELVRHGHVFAEGTIFPPYGSEEREARAAKAGLWSGDDVERPADYRSKVWEEAKQHAPDGCPIKGQVAGAARFYVLPWAPDYERARVQKARGERWFCSEQEAVAAGFKARG